MRYFFAFCFAFWGGGLLAQVTLNEVTFHTPCNSSTNDCQTVCSGEGKGWVSIINDNGTPLSFPSYTVAWKVGVSIPKPVAYVSGYTGRVSAKFSKVVGSTCALGEIYIRGVGDGGYTLCPKLLKSTGDFLPESFDFAFPIHIVKFIKDFSIKWYFTTDPQCLNTNATNIVWTYISTSTNPLYLTYAPPITGRTPATPAVGGYLDVPTTFSISSLHISCLAANDKSTESDVVNGIYSAFTGRCVSKFGSDICMKYWGSTANAGENIFELLSNNDGVCGQWANFFNDMIKLQGISGSKVTIITCGTLDVQSMTGLLSQTDINSFQTQINTFFGDEKTKVTKNLKAQILVKEWGFEIGDNFFGAWRFDNPQPTISLNNAQIIKTADNNGLPAQGNTNPRSYFSNHAVVEWNQLIFDPSYGSGPFSSESAWINSSLKGIQAGFCVYKKTSMLIYEIIWLKDKINIPISPITFSN
jgi:hypothetical protein